MKVKVKDLEALIQRAKERVGKEFSEYTVCIECIHGIDLESKRNPNSGWTIHKDSEGWEWIEISEAGDMIDTKKKLFGISANY